MPLVPENSAEAANALEALNAVTNNGRGSSVCHAVINELRRNDVEGAKMIAALDYDKVRQYPVMAKLFGSIGLISHKLQ